MDWRLLGSRQILKIELYEIYQLPRKNNWSGHFWIDFTYHLF